MGPFGFIEYIGLLQALLLVGGLGLVVFEMFNPGFGAPGITGVVLLAAGVILTVRTPMEAVILIAIILALLGIALVLVLHSASKGRLSKTLILSDALNDQSGFRGTENMEEYMGKEGRSVTPLRPAGMVIIEGIKLDVVTEGEFIPADTRVKVTAVYGRRIVVRQVK